MAKGDDEYRIIIHSTLRLMRAQKSSKSKKFAKDNADTLSSAVDELRNTNNINKKDFWNAVVDNLQETVRSISNSGELSLDQRSRYLSSILSTTSEALSNLSPKVPDKAPELWKDRDKTLCETPYEFAHRVYAPCIQVLTKNNLTKLDKSLVNRMGEYDAQFGTPDDELYIPTKRERREGLVQSVTWNEIMREAPPHIQEMLRAYRTRANRKSSSSAKRSPD